LFRELVLGLSIAPIACMCAGVRAQDVASAGSLADLSLEELSRVTVTSVSGRPESLRTAASSIFVISQEDIRRSGASTLPEVLQLAPNLQVARLNARQWAISARGFNNAIANKLLVLIDGRTIYSTLFAGVFWDFHDVVLEDIERIEVISGPGGTLWGANAVNGVINVITRTAAATQGAQASLMRSGSGGVESVRWGGRLGDSGHVRVYGLAIDKAATEMADGTRRDDDTRKHQAGFRADWSLGADSLTLQGDAWQGGDEPANNTAPVIRGGNLVARWESRSARGDTWRVHGSYDRAQRDDVTLFRNRASTWEVQLEHQPVLPEGHQLLWGGGYRVGDDTNDPSLFVRFDPVQRRLSWANVFAQYQRQWGKWQFTAGAKAERNSYSGVEFLPSVRAAYEHGPRSATWAAWSRVVRAPSRIDRDFFFPGTPPFFIVGGADFEPEVARVIELGHRGQAGRDVSYSATLFRQAYTGLRGGEGFPAAIANRFEGNVDGIEAWGQWQAARWARYFLGGTFLRKDLHESAPPADPVGIADLGNDPHGQWKFRAQFDVGPRTELDIQLRRVGALPQPAIPAYTALDLRLGFQVAPGLELSLIAQNALDRRHAEFEPVSSASFFGRTIFVKAVWQP
jgi:iron complex outermembrane receptor protein